MCANAQRSGRPAKYRWHPLFNAALWLTPTTRVPCSAAKTRNPLKLAGCPKLTKRSQPLVGRSSPYCKDVGEILLFNMFFLLSIHTLVAMIEPDKVMPWYVYGEFLAIFLHPVFYSEPHAARFRSAS